MFDLFQFWYAPSARLQSESWKRCGDFWLTGWSSMQTVFYRSVMISDACQGRIEFTHPEFSRMSQEKLEAAMKGTLAGSSEFQRLMLNSISQPVLNPAAALHRMLEASSFLDAAMKPVHEAAHANARRLRKAAHAKPRKPRA